MSIMGYSILLLLSLIVFAEALPQYQMFKSAKIVNGEVIDITKVPYQAHLESGSWCGAVIISDTVILSAAHCISENGDPSQYRVGVGSSMISSLQYYSVVEIGRHQNFSVTGALENDIGYIRLATPLTFSDKVQPIPLAEVSPAINSSAYISGWGVTEFENQVRSDQLYGLSMYIDECVPGQVIFSKICANNRNPNTTRAGSGDSGGPLTVDGKLVGLVSYIYVNPGNNRMGFANIADLRPWIKEHTGV